MISRKSGVIAATALSAANAMLIPPGVTSMDAPIGIAAINTNWQTVTLPCSDCIFSNPDKAASSADDVVSIQGGSGQLVVNVTTLWGGNAIGLDNYPLYPPLRSYGKPMVDLAPEHFPVKVTADTELVTEETVSPKGDALIRIKYQIAAINGQSITVDAIEITALKDAQKSLSLVDAKPVPKANSIFDSLPPQKGEQGKACNMPAMLCHFKDVVEAKMSELSHGLPGQFKGLKPGCKGNKWRGKDGVTRLPTHIRPHFRPTHEVEGKVPEGHRGRPWRHGRPGMHHGFHHHRHSVVHRVVMGLLFVLVPMMMGITMGMVVSILGMLVGRLIAFLWIKFVRGGKRGYASVRLDENEADAEDDKEDVESVMSEPLPRYEEVPEYSEKENS